MRMRVDTVRVIAAHELRATLRGRMVVGFAAIFSLLALGIALAGLGGSGQVLVQGFTRTAVSLMVLALYLFPLLGLILGAAAFGGEDGGTELLLAQPVERAEVLVGRAAGLATALFLVALAGFGVTGLVVAMRAGTAGIAGYLLVGASAAGVGVAAVAAGVLIGVVARRRAAAIGWALAAWFAAAVVYDLVAIGVLQVVGSGQPGPWLLAVLVANPIDGLRAVGLLALGADVLLGPTGAALQRLMGGITGAALVLASVLAWTAAPLALAARVFGRRDF